MRSATSRHTIQHFEYQILVPFGSHDNAAANTRLDCPKSGPGRFLHTSTAPCSDGSADVLTLAPNLRGPDPRLGPGFFFFHLNLSYVVHDSISYSVQISSHFCHPILDEFFNSSEVQGTLSDGPS